MPRKPAKARKKAAAPEPAGMRPDVLAIILVVIALFLLLSLVRYSTADLPAFGIGKGLAMSSEADGPTRNLIGPVGALIGTGLLQLLGGIAYLIPPVLLWIAGAVVLGARIRYRILLGTIALIVLGAALCHVTGMFDSLVPRHGLPSAGGWVGSVLGGLLERLLHPVGAGLLLVAAYLIALILTTGFHPITFATELRELIHDWLDERAEAKVQAQRMDPSVRKARRRAARSGSLLEKDGDVAENIPRSRSRRKAPTAEEMELPAKKIEPLPEVAPDPSDPEPGLPLRETPAPQIIDGTQRKSPRADLARPFERPKKDEGAEGGLSTEGYENYELPGFDLLEYEEEPEEQENDNQELLETQTTIVETLKAFGVDVTAGDITRGPTITRYEIYPSLGLRVSRITQLESDLARATKAERINILAPIPGKDTVGIEIANDNKVAVPLRELLQDDAFRSDKKKIPLALGKDVYGKTVIGDLAAMPHLLVAGATGSGKSVCINSIITSILYKFSPEELRFIMVDPKVVEMQIYSKLPHLVVPVVTDPQKVVAALRWTVNEMERRYKIFAKEGVRNFDSFNNRPRPDLEPKSEEELAAEQAAAAAKEENHEPVDEAHIESVARAFEDGDLGPVAQSGEDDDFLDELAEVKVEDKLPYIVVIIDELADLMQTAPADVEGNIARIAQKARAAGIHLIVATQTPRADVVTGIIKANIPSRIAFQVSSALDSRVILDTKGADKLVGKGDMLFLPPGSAKLERSQGAFVSDEEVEAIVDFCSNQTEQKFEQSIQESIERGGEPEGGGNDVSDADEEIIQKCIEVIVQEQKASTSLLQRRLRLGYTRAARMMDILEERNIIGPGDGAKARDILI